MIIVGELINSTRKAIALAIEQKDRDYLQDIAQRQVEAGADYINVITAHGEDEVADLIWLVDLIQEVVDIPLCIDSTNPQVLEAGLSRCRKQGMINSISAEEKKWEAILPLIIKYKPKVVAQCMDNSGMPNTVEKRLAIADKLVRGLREAGVVDSDIYLDPLVKPICINNQYALEVLESAEKLRSKYPDIHIVSSLSNISCGLPERKLINRVFAVMSAIKGMDAFILDPLDQNMMSLLAATKVLVGQDEYCMDYISGVRAGRIKYRDNFVTAMKEDGREKS